MTEREPHNTATGYNALRPAAPGVSLSAWVQMPAAIDPTRLDIDGHPVMQAWEAPYMSALARVAASNGGRVLEIGFGLGLSARALQAHTAPATVSNPIKEHLIIEANANVFDTLKAFAASAPSHTVTPIGPTIWQEALKNIPDASLDGVLYDTYPLCREEQHVHQFEFVTRIFPKLRDGAILTYCNLTSLGVLRPKYESWESLFRDTQLPHLLRAGFRESDLSFQVFPITPPDGCEYYQVDTAIVPVCMKRAGANHPPDTHTGCVGSSKVQNNKSESNERKGSQHAPIKANIAVNGNLPSASTHTPPFTDNTNASFDTNGKHLESSISNGTNRLCEERNEEAEYGPSKRALREHSRVIILEGRRKELDEELSNVKGELSSLCKGLPAEEGSGKNVEKPCVPRRVNAWTQWGNLSEIVVGVADNACFIPVQPACKPVINVEGGSGATKANNDGVGRILQAEIPWPQGRKKQTVVDAANRQLDNLAATLKARGVRVLRPRRDLDYALPIKTPFFQTNNQYCATCGRDPLITLGNIVLEAAMSRRDRYFEVVAYRDIISDLHQVDPKMLWKAAPKPTLSDASYRDEWWDIDTEERYKRMYDFEFSLTEQEPLFDAADMTRCGKDVFVQLSMTTNCFGLEWLRRELAPHGFRVHKLRFPYDLAPSHLDCTFVPLRPGLVLTNPDRPCMEEDIVIFKKNGWRFIQAPLPVNPVRPWGSQSSKWLSMNVLVIGPDEVVVEEQETTLQELLRVEGFEVIPVPFRDVYEFGGGLHCATWDIERDDTMVDFFPNQ